MADDGKGQHHQQGEVSGQMLMAMAEVVLEMVALILEGVEGFILDFPAGTASFHDRKDVGAPSEAWRFWQGERPCGVRFSRPPLPSVAPMAESAFGWRTKSVKRTQGTM